MATFLTGHSAMAVMSLARISARAGHTVSSVYSRRLPLYKTTVCLVTIADHTCVVVIYGIEEAVKEAQNGGSGVVIYFRKEGRALGEVTKVRTVLPYMQYHDLC